MVPFVKSEESKVALVLLLTFALLLITGVFPQYVLASTLVMVTLGILLGLYMWRTGRKSGDRKDERSERCSLLASRNAFMVMTLLTAFATVLGQLGTDLSMLYPLRSIWALGMAVYFLSFLVYKRAV
jgi:hypothetical protein